MRLACTLAPGRGDVDLLLARLAGRLAARGLRCAGTVQINSEAGPGRPCDMDVRLLPHGPVLRISQSLGPGARGCRLDPGALERCVVETMARLDDGPDLLIVNKFGKHEAEGRGFRDVIAEAMARDIPVLAGVNALNLDAFRAFAEGCATQLAPDIDGLARWAEDAVLRSVGPAAAALRAEDAPPRHVPARADCNSQWPDHASCGPPRLGPS